MRKEISQGSRTCQLCDEFIKKGESCYSGYTSGRYGRVGFHVHIKHCKIFIPKDCGDKIRCLTGNWPCKKVLCKYHS